MSRGQVHRSFPAWQVLLPVLLLGIATSCRRAVIELKLTEDLVLAGEEVAITDVGPIPGSTAYVLDGTRGEVHRVRREGGMELHLRDSLLLGATSVVAFADGSALFVGNSGASCVRLKPHGDTDLLPCSLPVAFERISNVVAFHDQLVVVGYVRGDRRVLHSLDVQTLAFRGSFGPVGRVMRPVSSDSTLLGWGLGLVAPGPGPQLSHASINPFVVAHYDYEGHLSSTWTDQIRLPIAEETELTVIEGDTVLLGLFPYVTGLMWLGERMLLGTYAPRTDTTTLWIFSGDGEVVGSGSVPFDFRIVAAEGDSVLYAVRRIGESQLVRYHVDFTRGPR